MPVISLETIFLFTLGALDLVWLRTVLPLPVWSTVANIFWVIAIVCLLVDLSARPRAARVRTGAIGAAVVLLLGVTTISLVGLRRQSGPASFVHDNAILIEEGAKQFLAGRNFYAADYHGTALEQWHDGRFYDATSQTWFENPALVHYITLPFYTLASAAVAWASVLLFGFYDQRFTHLLALILLAASAWRISRHRAERNLYLLALLLNPFMVAAVTMGTSDPFVLAWVMAAVAGFAARRPAWGAAALALAVCSKQTAWVVLPLLLYYWHRQVAATPDPRPALIRSAAALWPLPVMAGLILAPFALWDFPAFWDDIYRYPAGLLPTSYPIYGYGLSVLLQLVGLPATPRGYFPYGLLQAAGAVPVLLFMLGWQRRDNTLARAVGGSAVLLLVFWWLSRFFNENYIGVIIALLATAYVLTEENPKHQAPTKP